MIKILEIASPGYDLPIRAIFYCSRMLSAQLGTEFSNNADDPVKYGNISRYHDTGNTENELILMLTDLLNEELPVGEKVKLLEERQ